MNNACFDFEGVVNEKMANIEALEKENKELKQRNDDLSDELQVKRREMKDLENMHENDELKNSVGSQHEELMQVEMFKCKRCNFNSLTLEELKHHKNTAHSEQVKTDLSTKISNLNAKISEQKVDVISSIYNLKNLEIKSKIICGCKEKEYCRINHQKYSFIKSKSDELLSKIKNCSDIDKISTVEISAGARRKCFTCNMCDQLFSKQGQLKKHKKSEHRERR